MQYPATHLVVMGVAGSGKSTIAAALSQQLGWDCAEADEFHPQANIQKMSKGIPLQDEDRWPWLETLSGALCEAAEQKGVAVGACSALKRAYRDFLTEKAGEPILFVFLDGNIDVIRKRIEARAHEFMNPKLLDSQFATLERPADDENVLRVDVADPVETIATRVVKELTHLKVFKRGQ